jgi:hypothetical protein
VEWILDLMAMMKWFTVAYMVAERAAEIIKQQVQ